MSLRNTLLLSLALAPILSSFCYSQDWLIEQNTVTYFMDKLGYRIINKPVSSKIHPNVVSQIIVPSKATYILHNHRVSATPNQCIDLLKLAIHSHHKDHWIICAGCVDLLNLYFLSFLDPQFAQIEHRGKTINYLRRPTKAVFIQIVRALTALRKLNLNENIVSRICIQKHISKKSIELLAPIESTTKYFKPASKPNLGTTSWLGQRLSNKSGAIWTNDFGVRFRWYPAGNYDIGDDFFKSGRSTYSTKTGFWISEGAVAETEWRIITNLPPPTICYTSVKVRYNEAKTFLEKLSAASGLHCRLPTETEWACANHIKLRKLAQSNYWRQTPSESPDIPYWSQYSYSDSLPIDIDGKFYESLADYVPYEHLLHSHQKRKVPEKYIKAEFRIVLAR